MELGELEEKGGAGETHLLMCETLKKHTLSPCYESKKDVNSSKSTELDDILEDFLFFFKLEICYRVYISTVPSRTWNLYLSVLHYTNLCLKGLLRLYFCALFTLHYLEGLVYGHLPERNQVCFDNDTGMQRLFLVFVSSQAIFHVLFV